MHSVHKMRTISTDGVAWSVCLCVCRNGWTDRHAVWVGGSKEPCIR